jgi:rhamnose utilization protein RhaD (predicted bifunctional aldolase and dehydrogenase)
MTKAQKLADAKAETRRAERAALDAKIRLAIVREKLDAHETAEARRQRVLVQTAVERMVKAGALRPDDHAGQFDMTAQLLSDPSGLIPLALTKKIFRAGTISKTSGIIPYA